MMEKLYKTEREREDASPRYEERKKVSCLGPAGSFSENAARRLCPGYGLVLCNSFTEAVKKLLAGEVDHAVLPVENSLNGGVMECLDLLEEKDIFGTKELLLPVDQRLALLEGVKEEEIRFIYSHPQAFRQCSEFLSGRFPKAELRNTTSTAESLNKLDAHSAGIVGAQVSREGVVLSPENIADNKGNFTRFLLVGRSGEMPERSAMLFLCAVCPHNPGSLVGLLKIFLRHSINLTRIESRPVKEEFGQYRFFIELVGDIGTERVKSAISEAKRYCMQFKLLGAYN